MGQTAAYIDRSGTARSLSGDQDAPFVKVPPFPSQIDRIAEIEQINAIAAEGFYSLAPERGIDVEDRRILTVWIEYIAEEDDAILSLIPQAFNELAGVWFTIGLIDATIMPLMVTPISTIFGSRQVFQQELRSPLIEQDDIWATILQFEVSPYKRFRFLAADQGDVAAGGELVLDASTSQ